MASFCDRKPPYEAVIWIPISRAAVCGYIHYSLRKWEKNNSLKHQFSCAVVPDPWQLGGLQRARLLCPSPTPGVCSNSCPFSRWCHPTSSSSVIPFSSHLQSFVVSGSFPMSQFFASGGQSIRVSASASVLPMNIKGWFSLGLTGWSPCCPRESE